MTGAALLFALLAASDDQRRLAEESFARGEEAFGREEYAAAGAAFEQAALLSPHAASWLNAAEAWERAGELARAADDCEAARALDPSVEEEVERRLHRLAPRLHRLELPGSSGWRVQVDSSAPIAPPAKRWLSPGGHRIVSEHRLGERREQTIVAEAGGASRVELEEPLPAISSATVTDVAIEPGVAVAPLVILGVGVATGVAAAILGGLTLEAQSAFEQAPTREAADVFYDRRLATNVTLSAAIVAAAVGVVWWLVDWTANE
jgi:tetratricopeptide (TPR) repeat protein